MENKSRQNNICIYNVKEPNGAKNMIEFLQKLIAETLEVPGVVNLIRAHRMGKEQTNFTRPIIAAFSDFDTKKKVLKAAWDKKQVLYENERILFDNDYTYKTRRQRALYKPIREYLKHQSNIKTHILAPAKLKVFNPDGTTTTYPNPTEAASDLEKRGLYKAEGHGKDKNATTER